MFVRFVDFLKKIPRIIPTPTPERWAIDPIFVGPKHHYYH